LEATLDIKDLKRLEKLLPEYCAKRSKGMHAGNIADKLDLPLKDVISFLIEKSVLKDEQVDLELARVILAKNPHLRESIAKRIKLPYEKLDYALATQDEKTLREAVGASQMTAVYIILPQVAIFLIALKFPYNIAVMLLTAIASLLLTEAIGRATRSSIVETAIKMLKNE